MPTPLRILLPLAATLILLPAIARANEPDRTRRVSGADGLVLDGRIDEAAWQGATRLEAGPLSVPFPASSPDAAEPEIREVVPEIRVLLSDAELWLAVRVAEPPGSALGVSLMVASEAMDRGGDAVVLAYSPQDARGPRYVARGPRGIGREAYPIRGAVRLDGVTHWSIELAVPLASLVGPGADAPIRLAAAVRSRTPGCVAWAPADAAFAGPASGAFYELRPASQEGWPSGESAGIGAEARAEEDRRDRERLRAWHRFAATDRMPPEMMLSLSMDDPRRATTEQRIAKARELLLPPLEEMATLRPDLAAAHVVRGHVLRDLGDADAALEAFDEALRIVPGLREARAGIWLAVRGPGVARGRLGEATDYAAALGRAAALADGADTDDPLVRDGIALGRARLDYLGGDLDAAAPALIALAKRHPHEPEIVLRAERARDALTDWHREEQYRLRDERRDDLPRVRLETTKGAVVLELFEDDVANTVKHFVWLARHGFYDGTYFDWNVSFLGVRGGGAGDAGTREVGYAIGAEPTERKPSRGASSRRRRLFRGTIALATPHAKAQGGAFLLTTGTAVHLDDDFSAFGWVREGQDVVDALVAGDRILKAEVLRTRPGVEYRPVTTEGVKAPEPR